jgi:hypothetical protein
METRELGEPDARTKSGGRSMNAARMKALELLQSPDFFCRFLDAVRKAGLVGEELNALVVFIVSCSRLLANPLHLFVKGPSSAGKNFLVRTVLKFLPPKHVSEVSSSTDAAWNYLGKKLMHKVLYFQEVDESSGAIHGTRLLISENRLVRYVTVWKKGKRVTVRQETKGPIASMSTSTRDRLKIDDETRRVSIRVDESQEQTKRITAAKLAGVMGISQADIEVWWEVQRLLAERASWPIERPKWFRELDAFIPGDLSVRRHLPAFLEAVNTVCLIRSFRKDPAELEKTRRLKITFRDFAIAALTFNEGISTTLDERDKEVEEVCSALQRASSSRGGEPVSASALASELGVSLDIAYARLRKARSSGAVRQSNKPGRTNRKLYLPRPRTRFLADPEEIFEQLTCFSRQLELVHPVTGKWVVYGRRKKRRGKV